MKLATKILLPSLVIGLLIGGGAFLYGYSKNKEPVVDQSSLYIGIPKEQDGMPTTLLLTVKSSSGVATKTYSSEDLSPLKGQDKNIVFLNYTADPLIPLGNTDIGYWLKEEKNSIQVQTECLEFICSDYVNIDKAGVWFINVANKDGAKPEYSHSDIYWRGALL